MNYPFWDIDIGYGILMALISVIHVFVSHFAIGGGLYLVISEWLAHKKQDQARLLFLQKLSKFFVLVSVVFGALTGVGIWFVIGLLNPAATEVLIHNFVFGWAIEWTFFLIEITAAILYFYGWQKMSPRKHMTIGWIYFISAWLSLFVINGIITFMLTPGQWLATGNFFDGLFNPTFWSSLVLRTGVCIMLAGVYALLVASRNAADKFKACLVRYNSIWVIIGLAVMLPSLFWYVGDIPEAIKEPFLNTHLTPISAMNASFINYILIAVFVILFGLIIPKRYYTVIGVLVMIFALSWFGEYEWMRESIRKPYIITGYMYGNGILVANSEKYLTDGMLPDIKFTTGDDGGDLFRRACRSCHTIDGYKPLNKYYDGTDDVFIAQSTMGLHVMKSKMPRFFGTEDEAMLLAAHIYKQVDQRHLSEIYNLSGVELGKKVYDIRCGTCHQFGGFNDKTASLAGLEEQDYHDILDMAGDFADEMPDFTADSKEREALIQYLMTIKEGGN